MAGPLYFDRVQETTTTSGTGTYTLAGAVTGFQSFAAVGNANTCYYGATDGVDWEVGLGTYTSAGTTLARTAVLASSNGGAAVNWSGATKNIWVDSPALFFTGLVTAAAAFSPTANDGKALGTTALSWSDLFLASGGVLNWNNGNVTLTQSANALAFAGVTSGVTADGPLSLSTTATGTLATLTSTDAGATSGPNLELYRNSASPAASDVLGVLYWYGKDSAANKQEYASSEVTVVDATSTSEDAILTDYVTVGGARTAFFRLGALASGTADPNAAGLPLGQLSFPATQNPSTNANTLDDYEEGTWTPGLTFGGSATGVTFSSTGGTYIKIGRLVGVQFNFTLTNNGSGSGLATLTGLPFTSDSGSFGQLQISSWSSTSGVVGNPTLTVSPTTTTANFNMSGATASVNMTDTNITNTTVMIGGGVYFTAS